MIPPPWSSLAADAIRRLQNFGADETAGPDAGAAPDPLDWLDDPQAGRSMSLARALAASPSAMQLPFDEQREIAMAGGNPQAVAGEHGAEPTPPRLPTDRLLLMLRLCATFGSAAAVEAMTHPRAITVLEHGKVPEDMIREMLDQALLPRGTRCSIGWEHRDPDPAALCVLVLKARDGYTYTRFRLDRDLERLLAQPRGILILAPHLEDLPGDLRALLPAPLALSAVNSDILAALLRLTHPAATETPMRCVTAFRMTQPCRAQPARDPHRAPGAHAAGRGRAAWGDAAVARARAGGGRRAEPRRHRRLRRSRGRRPPHGR